MAGTVTNLLRTPRGIAQPEYVGKAAPSKNTAGDQYTAEEIELIRASGTIAADAIEKVAEAIKPGVTTAELDRIGHDYVVSQGAYPSALGYRGFPRSICTSVNEVICHGIPDDTVLEEGDIINIDITAFKDGYHGDLNRTFGVGTISTEAQKLIERTEESLRRAIKAVMPGRAVNVLGRVIESYAQRFGYGVVRDFTGHGVGRAFHTGLIIPHYDAAPAYAQPIEVGQVFTIEPMLTLGTIEHDLWEDGWTASTKDKKLTAQFEHTLAVTQSGADILTLSTAERRTQNS